ncbi:hypothetical protein PIROE2DRAFT_17572 [Piromyces sp. E2]|nr:hypothetical protein PIROE2DRAFT_17572 [Piromyces sp. E2]|eukprot:OUM57448.1 hypothetical protein PIROE2DRAFT_17572 [Piromyces sp. E2]
MITIEAEAEYNPFYDGENKIISNLYLTNIDKRLEEISCFDEVDCQRWIYELAQNAKDSIAHQKDKKVDIEIIVENNNNNNNKIIFKHNGSPFTVKALFALLYKYSEGKENDEDSTGRYGTGFLSSHCLSKIVKVSGDFIIPDQTEPKGFTFTIYRDGKNHQELLEGLKKSKDSFKYIKSDGWTKFEYIALSEKNQEAARLGIENLKNNVAQVMLFCPTINSITINEKDKNYFTIKRGEKIEIFFEGCQKSIFKIKDGDVQKEKSFIYTSINEPNEKLKEKFNTERNLRICCALELDMDNNIYINKSSPCLFCSLPLIGSEKHILPFIINSPDFEPHSERRAILLNGDEKDLKTGKISNQGINKMILLKSQEMFKVLLKCIDENKIKKRYLLLRGLSKELNGIQYFDSTWYMKKFIEPMREILIQFPLIRNSQKENFKLITDKDFYIPKINEFKDLKQEAYDFISDVYNHKVPTLDESIYLEESLWENDNRINCINMEDCVKYLSEKKTMKILNNEMDNAWEWIDKFLVFIKNSHHPEYLKKYCVVPNMEGNFVRLTNDLATCKNVEDDMIKCLEIFDSSWKLKHIHKNIKNYSNYKDHNVKYTISKIQENLEYTISKIQENLKYTISKIQEENPKIQEILKYTNSKIQEEWDKILKFIAYIPIDIEDEKFVQKRETIYELYSNIWELPEKVKVTKFQKKLWDGIDEFIFKQLIREIGNIKNKELNDKFTIDYMVKFLKCLSENYSIFDFKEYSIIPNQNKKLCKYDELYVNDMDVNISNILKECMKCFGKDINDNLIHDQLKDIITLENHQKRKIYDYRVDLRNNFESKEFSSEVKQQAAKYMIRIIPEYIENQDNCWQNRQRKLFEIFKVFNKERFNGFDVKCDYYELWENSNEYICKNLINIINENKIKNVNSLANYLNLNDEKSKVFEYLKIIINVYPNDRRSKIIPNQNEEFCNLNELSNEGMFDPETKTNKLIEDNLMNDAKKIGYDVRKFLVHRNELLEKAHKDSSKPLDHSIKEVEKNLMKEHFKSTLQNSNPFNKEDIKSAIFEKLYIANVKNRLYQLETPIDADKNRWVYELIQNAKDSNAHQKDRKGVDIDITVKGNEYIFKHNGAPFTFENLYALLYKFSEGKENDPESTGRYGTGFLTTHCVSKTVEISGEIILDQTDTKGFSVTMCREGNSEDVLIQNLKKLKKVLPETKENQDAGEKGIKNLENNIARVMLFCQNEINSITINNNGKIFTIEQGKESKDFSKGCQKITFKIKDSGDTREKSFIYTSINEPNEKLKERFHTERNLRICCAIELDNINNIYVDELSPCLFCSLPLVGSEKHILPFIIDSPDFEPNFERNALLLNGSENEKTNIISKQGINKMILMRSLKMYEDLLNAIISNNIGERYHMMRDVLVEFPIINCYGNKYYSIKNIYRPLINMYENDDDKEIAYNFIAEIYNYKVPTMEQLNLIDKYLWKDDKRINDVNMLRCVRRIRLYKDMDTLSKNIKNNDIWKWIDDFLEFIKRYHSEYLGKYSIIPNMNGQLINLTKDLATSHGIPENMIQCLEDLEIEWKKTHIHKKIKKYSPGHNDDIKSAAIEIIKCIDNGWPDKILKFMCYIPENGDEKFVLFSEIIKNVENSKYLGRSYSIEFIKEFLECVSKYYPKYYKYSIIPNQNGQSLNIGKRSIYDYRDILKKYFMTSNFSNTTLEKAAKYLIKIIPKKSNNEMEDDQDRQRKLFNLYKSFKKRNYDYEEIERNDYNTDIWRYSNKYIFAIIRREIERFNDVNSLARNIGYNEDETLSFLKQFIKFSQEGKIIPNQNNILCNIEDLCNDIENIPEKLKDIAEHLNYHVRNNLVHKSMDNPCSKDITYREVCYEIDERIKNNYNDTNKHSDPKFKKAARYLIEEYFKEIIDINEEKRYFPYTSSHKEIIILNVLYTVEDRKNMTELGKLGDKCISSLLENKDAIQLIMEGKLWNNSNTLSFIKQYDDETIGKINDNQKLLNMIINNELNDKYCSIYGDDILLSKLNDSKVIRFIKKKYFADIINKFDELIERGYTIDNILNSMENYKLVENHVTYTHLPSVTFDSSINHNEIYYEPLIITSTDDTTDESFIKKIEVLLDSSITPKERTDYENNFRCFIKYYNDTLNKRIGNCGEAYIYELLRNSGKYKSVRWCMLNENGNEILEYRGKTYTIMESGLHYDILVETMDNRNIFIEVKSTRYEYEYGNKVPFYLSQQQIRYMEKTIYPDEYVLAIVFDVMNNPKHFFLNLREKV